MAQPLSAFTGEWIWGDDEETTVFAQGYGSNQTAIFSFTRSPLKPAEALSNRICNSFHGLDVAKEDESTQFANSAAMRKALWDSIRAVWPACLMNPAISNPAIVFDVDSSDSSLENIVCKDYRHPAYDRFLLALADEALGRSGPDPGLAGVPFRSLIRYEQLGGRGCATRVKLPEDPDRFFVFKGIDFRTFLSQSDGEEDAAIRHTIRGWHNSNNLLERIPPHANVMPPPVHWVTMGSDDAASEKPIFCGTLQQLYPGGDVGTRVEKSNEAGRRLPLELKAHWCANMAAALAHTHRVARTYHMDVKPGNFIVDAEENLVLGDWEQTDAPATTLAPEADGTWDVLEEKQAEGGGDTGASSQDHQMEASTARLRLRYMKYSGPPRRNVDEDVLADASWHTWNVFPVWLAEHPFALELAEVFSLGRSMWMLLRQPDMDFDEVEHPNDLVTDWVDSNDIPKPWKQFVDRCMSLDPNKRPDVLEVAQFWDKEWKALQRDN
ncbi:hypothetical protein F5Y03DRAFT_34024 [Xylaria venustula]|nr:hypothetical protein F5Y03DRAFT_34024 [Xylaria venustula]